MSRELLPNRRASDNFQIKWNGMVIKVTVGYYEDGRPGEIFVDTDSKRGSSVDIAARDVGLLMSLALQYGCCFDAIKKSVTPDSLAGMVATVVSESAHLMEREDAL